MKTEHFLPLIDHRAESRLAGYDCVAQYVQISVAPAARTAISDFKTTVDQLARDRELSLPFIFRNDAGPTDDPLAGYGALNIAKLKAASIKYDSAASVSARPICWVQNFHGSTWILGLPEVVGTNLGAVNNLCNGVDKQ